jgi:hypothetical protein
MEWTPKSPADDRLYSVDFSEIYPDSILTAVFTRTAGTVVLTQVNPDPRTAYVIVAGGADGETATISLLVTTALGQEFTRTITLRISLTADVLGPDSTITKGTLIIRALGKLGIANYVFDTEAEEDNSALRQLDSMAARWQDKLDGLPYHQPLSNGQSLPSDTAGIDEADIDAFISNLAVTLAPDYGKAPAGGVLKQAADSRSELFTKYRNRVEYQLNSMTPLGAGNRFSRRTFFPPAP